MLSNSVNLDPKSGTVENELLEGFSKEIDLSEKNTFNISALKQVTKGMLATGSLFYVSFEFLVKLDSFFPTTESGEELWFRTCFRVFTLAISVV